MNRAGPRGQTAAAMEASPSDEFADQVALRATGRVLFFFAVSFSFFHFDFLSSACGCCSPSAALPPAALPPAALFSLSSPHVSAPPSVAVNIDAASKRRSSKRQNTFPLHLAFVFKRTAHAHTYTHSVRGEA